MPTQGRRECGYVVTEFREGPTLAAHYPEGARCA